MELKFDVPNKYGNLLKEVMSEALKKLQEEEWPQVGDKYYCITSFLGVESFRWDGRAVDSHLSNAGNCFKTEEEAKFKIEQLKVLHELEELANDNNEWDAYDYHYYIHYNVCTKQIVIGANYIYVNGNRAFYFDSAELAQAAINKIGADRLIKYYFCIPEEK